MFDGRMNVSEVCIMYVRNNVAEFDYRIYIQLECGPMPNVMAAVPNIGGALCSMVQSLADAHYYSAVQ